MPDIEREWGNTQDRQLDYLFIETLEELLQGDEDAFVCATDSHTAPGINCNPVRVPRGWVGRIMEWDGPWEEDRAYDFVVRWGSGEMSYYKGDANIHIGVLTYSHTAPREVPGQKSFPYEKKDKKPLSAYGRQRLAGS